MMVSKGTFKFADVLVFVTSPNICFVDSVIVAKSISPRDKFKYLGARYVILLTHSLTLKPDVVQDVAHRLTRWLVTVQPFSPVLSTGRVSRTSLRGATKYSSAEVRRAMSISSPPI